MTKGSTPSTAPCDTCALDATVEFGKKQRITGTPTLFFIDGTRVPGAVPIAQVEKLLTEIKPCTPPTKKTPPGT